MILLVPQDAIVVLDQPTRCGERARDYIKQLGEDIRELQRRGQIAMSADSYYLTFEGLCRRLEDYPLYMADAFTLSRNPIPPRTITSIPAKQLPSYAGNAEAAADDVRLYLKENYRVVVLAADERRAKVLQEFFSNHDIPALIYRELERLPEEGHCAITLGAISAGMEYPGLRLAVLTDAQLVRERREKKQRSTKKLPEGRQRIESCADLSVGDYVVHENHGIGRFAGIVKMQDFCLCSPSCQACTLSHYVSADYLVQSQQSGFRSYQSCPETPSLITAVKKGGTK